MNSKSHPRFDPHALRDLAGDAVFARGEAYFQDGMVDILGIEPTRILARVAGTEYYRTVITGQRTAIDGECSCPAFEREGFCKHMVAVALAAMPRLPPARPTAATRLRGFGAISGLGASMPWSG